MVDLVEHGELLPGLFIHPHFRFDLRGKAHGQATQVRVISSLVAPGRGDEEHTVQSQSQLPYDYLIGIQAAVTQRRKDHESTGHPIRLLMS